MDDDRLKRKLALRRRKRAVALLPEPKLVSSPKPKPKITAKQRAEVWQGWYVCCGGPWYVGFGWRKPPLCDKCGKRSRTATGGQVYDDEFGEVAT